MKVRREPVAEYRYIVEMSAKERQALLDGMLRFRTCLSIPSEDVALNDLITALQGAGQ